MLFVIRYPITVERQSSIDVRYPACEPDSAFWVGSVFAAGFGQTQRVKFQVANPARKISESVILISILIGF